MPATYTYNDAIDDAKRAVMRAWEEKFAATEPEKYMSIVLEIVGRLDRMKRPSRRKRSRAPHPSRPAQP